MLAATPFARISRMGGLGVGLYAVGPSTVQRALGPVPFAIQPSDVRVSFCPPRRGVATPPARSRDWQDPPASSSPLRIGGLHRSLPAACFPPVCRSCNVRISVLKHPQRVRPGNHRIVQPNRLSLVFV